MRTPVRDDPVLCGHPVHSPQPLVERLHELAEQDTVSDDVRLLLAEDAHELSISDVRALAEALSQALERMSNRWRDLAYALRAHVRARTLE